MSELEVKKDNLPAELKEWGDGPNVTAQDLVLPKLLPLQYMSEKVKNKQGEYGEFRDTVANELFGSLEKPFEVIPFFMQKKWVEFDMIPQRGGGYDREFKQIVLIQDNPTREGFNDDLPLVDEAAKVERDRVMDFFCLIPEQIKEGNDFPYVLSFQRTSLKAGKKLGTQMYVRNKMAGLNPAATAIEVSGQDVQNDKGSYVVQDIRPSRAALKEEQMAALKWLKIVNTSKVKVDDSEYSESDDLEVEDIKDF